MTEAEVWSFLADHRRVQVCTNGPDGWPHVVPMSYYMDDGAVFLWTDGDSRKIRNLRADDRISLLVEEGSGIEDFRAVQIRGRAELIEDHDASARIGTKLFERHAGSALDEAGLAYVDSLAHLRTGVRVVPGPIVSWDHRKMHVDIRTIGS
jgi:PPOX class probable F420-dependent enzyme